MNRSRVFSPKEVISSIPITEMVGLLKPEVPSLVLQAAQNLKFRSHVGLFIRLDRESVMPDQWIYFPEKKIPFGRVSEPKNFSKNMSPRGKTSLLVEFFCWENDSVWNAESDELMDMSREWLTETGLLKEPDVIGISAHRERHAYPIYELGYEENLNVVKGYLHGLENLQMVGRSGLFRYNNQDHSLEMGILAGENIKGGVRLHDVEKIGIGPEYLERGTHDEGLSR
jgi:protoporphyrinogen oxidase